MPSREERERVESVRELLDYWAHHYTSIHQQVYSLRGHKIFLGTKLPRICRFCGLDNAETTFKTKAHVFPTFLGNHSILHYEECDKCNRFISEYLEDHLDKYLGASRTFSGLESRTGVPTYKSKKLRIDGVIVPGKAHYFIRAKEDDSSYMLDPENNRLTLHVKRGPHIKQQVFKCFVKMALSIMPVSELENFLDTIRWIMSKDINGRYMEPLKLLETYIPGFMPQRHIRTMLLKRQDGIDGVPYMQFLFGVSNWLYQLSLPTVKQDKILIGKTYAIRFMPSGYEEIDQYGSVSRKVLDMTTTEITKEEDFSICLRGSNLEDIRSKT